MTDNNKKLTPISNLGEFGLIDLISKNIKLYNTSTIKGIGDDSAVLDFKDKKTLLSTDMLVENIHFDLSYTPLKYLGYKAVIVNLSDIYSMNATPSQITVSIAVSNRFTVEAIEELYKGINLACDLYNIDLVGGDTTSSNFGLIINITCIGYAEEKDITYRSGAKKDDLIILTGNIGASYMGLNILRREKKVWEKVPDNQPNLEKYKYLLERHLKPEARKDTIQYLKDNNIKPTSMIDLSDGLSSEIIHICKSSNVGCNLYEEKIPKNNFFLAACDEFGIEPTTACLNGGEDYELLFTIDIGDFEKIKGNLLDFSIIGHITDKDNGIKLIINGSQAVDITAQGWDSFLN